MKNLLLISLTGLIFSCSKNNTGHETNKDSLMMTDGKMSSSRAGKDTVKVSKDIRERNIMRRKKLF